MSEHTHTVSRTIAAPTDRVWSVLGDVDRWADWLPTVTTVRSVEPGQRPGVGAAYVLEQPGLPKATWTMTDWQPGRSFTWRSTAVGVRSLATHEVRPTGTGATEVELGIGWSGPLAFLVQAAFGRRTQRYIEQEALALAGQSQA